MRFRLIEKAPSKITKTQNNKTTRVNQIDIGYGNNYAVPEEDDYYSNDSNGYIMDKNGNEYQILANTHSGDTGRIIGGTTYYSVDIYYPEKTLHFAGRISIASKNDYEVQDLVTSLRNGIYLEDYCAKYKRFASIECEDIVEQLAESGSTDSKSAAEIKQEKILAKVEKDFTKVSLPLYRELIFTIKGRSITDSGNYNSKNYDFENCPNIIRCITNSLNIGNFNITDFSGAAVKLECSLIYDTDYKYCINNKTGNLCAVHFIKGKNSPYISKVEYEDAGFYILDLLNMDNTPVYNELSAKDKKIVKELSGSYDTFKDYRNSTIPFNRIKNILLNVKGKDEDYEKMKSWAEGGRKQNIKSCTDGKLKRYYRICKEMGYSEQVGIIENEFEIRGIPY